MVEYEGLIVHTASSTQIARVDLSVRDLAAEVKKKAANPS